MIEEEFVAGETMEFPLNDTRTGTIKWKKIN